MMKKNSIYLENNNLESKRKDMFQIFINLGHNTLILSETQYNINSNTYLSELYKYVGNKLEDSGYSSNNYYLTSIGKILPIIDIPISDYGIQNNSNINLDYRLVGGNPLELIVDFFNSAWQLALLIYPGILFIGKLLFWLVQLLMWMFKEFLNPINIVTDLMGSVTKIARFVILAGANICMAFVKSGFNMVFEPIFGNIWGWDYDTTTDNVVYSDDINDTNNDTNKDKSKSKVGYKRCSKDGKICYNTGYDTIPFSVIMATILMPPLGVLMEFGISYWVNIIICGILTLMFYFPGLLYALILLYC
jgi:uncharacterized membrane protein YqaE (UPF0057 family)